jgi:RNA-directed DNA polymerase
MDRVRRRVGDKRVLALVKAFLKAGILTVDGAELGTLTGTRWPSAVVHSSAFSS